jgi:hypothetical protein
MQRARRWRNYGPLTRKKNHEEVFLSQSPGIPIEYGNHIGFLIHVRFQGSRAQNAKPVGRIDCQSHLSVPELLAFMEKRQASPRVYRKGNDLFVVINDWVRSEATPGNR